MSPHIGTGAGEGDNAFGRSRNPSGLTVWNRDPSLQPMGVSRSPAGLDLYALDPNVSARGWAVYTFKRDGVFTVVPGAVVQADVLLIGGGGAGGGGEYGGGGGAGGFVDRHGVLIYSHEGSHPHGLAYPDGEVTVGDGGAAVPWDAVAGPSQQGQDSLLGTQLIAHGGGYGGRNGGIASYSASDGASGGGARGNETWLRNDGGIDLYEGIPGRAIYNQAVPEGGDAKDYEEGHDGGKGGDSSAWYNHSAGGGGGASWPAHDRAYSIGGTHMTGGLGRVCDIRGWYTCPDPMMGGLYREAGMTWVEWWAGGGAGMEKPNLWSYPSGGDGYRGGGSCASDGAANTGGGGGGYGYFGADTPEGETPGNAPGRAGGSGIVIVRIPMSQRRYVTAPLQDTDGNGVPMFNQVWDPYLESFTQVPVYPTGVTYSEVPTDEPHIDMRGDAESAFIWTHLRGEHGHRWGWDDSEFPV